MGVMSNPRPWTGEYWARELRKRLAAHPRGTEDRLQAAERAGETGRYAADDMLGAIEDVVNGPLEYPTSKRGKKLRSRGIRLMRWLESRGSDAFSEGEGFGSPYIRAAAILRKVPEVESVHSQARRLAGGGRAQAVPRARGGTVRVKASVRKGRRVKAHTRKASKRR